MEGLRKGETLGEWFIPEANVSKLGLSLEEQCEREHETMGYLNDEPVEVYAPIEPTPMFEDVEAGRRTEELLVARWYPGKGLVKL